MNHLAHENVEISVLTVLTLNLKFDEKLHGTAAISLSLAMKYQKETESFIQQCSSTLFQQMGRGKVGYLREICETPVRFAQLKNMRSAFHQF